MVKANYYTDLKNKTKYAALILAGGHSSRMKAPKPWLEVKNGKSFLQQIIDLYSECGINDSLVVLNEKYSVSPWGQFTNAIKDKATIVLNKQVDSGRMYSLILGLEEVKDADFIFIHNVDNPFIEKHQIINLMENNYPMGYTKPTFKGKGGHPVLISNSIGQYIQDEGSKFQTLKEILIQFPAKKVEFDNPNILMNINTDSDYKKAISEYL